jgi:hypothetical protein
MVRAVTLQTTPSGSYYNASQGAFATVGAPSPVAPNIATTSPLLDATRGAYYSQTFQATGGTTPYSWALAGGTLPPGLSLNSTSGLLSGTPYAAGSYSFTLRCTGADGAHRDTSFSLAIPAPAGTFTLTVSASPSNGGTVSGDGTFPAGSGRTATANAASGFVFANWTENGTVVSTSSSYTFTLDHDWDLVANFVARTYVPAKATYNGLIYEAGGVSPGSAGSFTLTTSATGKFSMSFQVWGARYSLSGAFDASGSFTGAISRGKLKLFTVRLQIDPADADRIAGTIWDTVQDVTANLAGDRAVFNSRSNPTPQAGRYTLAIPGSSNSPTEPGGDGYGTITVATSGRITFAGSLADGTAISQSATLSKNGDWPLYIPLYRSQGLILSWITFTATPDGDLSGDLTWIKPYTGTAKYYPGGFRVGTPASGSRYIPPARGTPILNFSNARIGLTGGDLANDILYDVVLGSDNRVTGPSKVSLTFTLSTGAFKGSMPNRAGGKAISYAGAVLQKRNGGVGYFLDTGQSGKAVFLEQ